MNRVASLAAIWALGGSLALTAGASSAHADEGAKRLSVDLSFGVRPDMASLGQTIAQDGTIDTADSTMANLVYSTGQALMGDRNNMAIWHNSSNTNSTFRLLGEEPEVGGPLLGLDIGANARYELDDHVGFPLFVRAGFHYITSVSGGQQRRVLGDAAQANPDIAGLLMANGENPADYIGGVMESEYSASWLEIPITVGFKVAINEDSFMYAGAGISLFRGGFSVGMNVDENYANVLATHIDTEALTVTNLSPGAVNETVEFQLGGVGVNYMIGGQAAIADTGAVVFLELNSSGAAKTVYSSRLDANARRLLTATSSASLYSEDPEWFKRLAFPVVAGGGTMRVGLRYYFL
ncbi:porin OmpL1 [Haliangium ochraceum]|uniref:Outer membrane protein beta-barrel domain-containing protein n=1 Tax=Haliangium ochraceum (strain DSM 14365 / JCM 11303 / SMP-2) TaxID=502025 RepID=D0LRV8_HALO1|nr:porin OmpL1 [Haliangium ochraceum]ACY19100.1 hypothetical protein Hoch_6634 [Haliangium ochraceum DSM 14365]